VVEISPGVTLLPAPEPDRDTWCTPRGLALMVGPWDLDPCSNPRSHIVSRSAFSLETGRNGLALARYVSRSTRVWCNPPYSHGNVIKWVLAYRHTRFCFLVRHDPSTEWWAALWPYVGVMATPIERVAFEPPPGVEEAPGSPFPHVLLYASPDDVTEAVSRACYCATPMKGSR
jgi:hypothetical protein